MKNLLWAVLLVLASCSSDSGNSGNPAGSAIDPYPDGAGPPAMEPNNCNTFPFEQTKFEAGEAFAFTLPREIDNAPERAMWVHSDKLAIPYPLGVMAAEGIEEKNGLFMPIPSTIGTTKYTLQLAGTLADGTEFSCPTHDIEITLSPAPEGTAKAFAAKLGLVVDAMAARHGGNRALLESIANGEDVGEVDGTLYPLSISNFYLRKPVDGLIEGLERLSADELRYLDAGLAVVARASELEALAASFDGTMTGASAFRVDIQNASDLAFWTKQRTEYCGALKTGYANSVLAAGMIGIADGVVGSFATGYASVGTIMLEIGQAFCDLLPARLVNLRIETPVRVMEDEPGLTTSGSPIGAKSTLILVDAKSNKWSWVGSAFRVALQFLAGAGSEPFKIALRGALAEVKGAKFLGAALPAKTTEHLIEVSVGVTSNVIGFFAGEISVANDGADVYPQIGPFEWKDIDLNDPRWMRIVSRTNVVRPYDDGSNDVVYQFTKVGEDAVTFVPKLEEFPLRELDEKLLFMGVDKIDIGVPEEILLSPGESVDINYVVRNALDASLDWSAAAGTLRGFTVVQTSVDSGVVEHVAPNDASLFPYIIEVSSRADQGLRTPSLNPPDRRKMIIVRAGDVSISPRGVCVPNGETLDLQVATRGPLAALPQALTLNGEGTLSGKTYTAPAEGSGVAEVTVTVGEFSDKTTFSYGACTCYFSVTSQQGAHSREYGMVLTDFSIGDFVENGESAAPIVTMSMGTSLTQILTDPRYVLSFAPGFWKTATMREGLDGDFTADLRGESQFDAGWFSNGGWLETDALQYLGRPRLTGHGVVYHGDPENPFPVQVSFSMVFDESICATESLFKGFSAYPDYVRPIVPIF